MKLTTVTVFIAGVISVSVGGFLSDWLVRKNGLLFSRRLLGMMVIGGGAMGLLITGLFLSNIVAIIALALAFVLWSFNGIINFSTCIDIGGNYAGGVAGVMNCYDQFGGFLLSIVFGRLAQVTQSFTLPVIVVAVILFIGCMLWLLMHPEKPLMAIS